MSIQAMTATSEGAVRSGTLREAIEIQRLRGGNHTVREAVAIVVPLCAQLVGLHAEGRRFFVHPSSLLYGKAGTELDLAIAATPPTHARDRACVAPECRKGDAGDARATVFSLGAIFYELVTGESVGPGMKRPREADPSLSATLEVVLGKALVADPRHRPHDIAALAQAFHHLAPAGSMAPPPADESHLDHEEGFEVDVSLSMLPPAPSGPVSQRGPDSAREAVSTRGPVSSAGGPPSSNGSGRFAVQATASNSGMMMISREGPYMVAEGPRSQPNPEDPTAKLAALKQRLESDPQPRWVVVKDGMDHGPFTAVELLQQIASHSFISTHALRDTTTNEEKPIAEWGEFALFAQHSGLNREIKQERKALEAVVSAEKHRTQWKALLGMTLLGLIAAGAVGWWLKERARSKQEQNVQEQTQTSIDTDAALSGRANEKGKPGGGGTWTGGGGGGKYPQLAGGQSCQGAQAKYVEDYTQQGVPPDLTGGAYGAVLNNGGYLNACGVPQSMSVSICAAVQNGRAVGVTVVTTPANPGIASCVRGAVSGLSFPAHPRLDVTTTTFAGK